MVEECSICLDILNNDTNKILTCNHIFHKKCIDTWLKRNNICPLCRDPQNEYYYARLRQFPFFNYKLTIENNNLLFEHCFNKIKLNLTKIKTIKYHKKLFDIIYFDDNQHIKEFKLKFNNSNLSHSLFTNIRKRLIL